MPIFKVGTDDFKELRDDGGYFVDKSLLIKEVIAGSKALLLPRPRRFGKTLNLSMLRYFFEKSADDRAYLFQDLAIASLPEVMAHQGKYPVIYSELEGYQRRRLGEQLGADCGEHHRHSILQHSYLLEALPPVSKRDFEAITLDTGRANRLREIP